MTRTKFPDESNKLPQVIYEGNNKPGRLGVWHDSIPERAYMLMQKGLTDRELAIAFGVNETTIDHWKQEHPEFYDKSKQGKEEFDTGEVQSTLLRRALGFEYKEKRKVDGVNANGDSYSYTTETKKLVLPDVTAIIFWLKNRDKLRWADVHKIDATNNINIKAELDIALLSNQEKEMLRSIGIKQLALLNGNSNN